MYIIMLNVNTCSGFHTPITHDLNNCSGKLWRRMVERCGRRRPSILVSNGHGVRKPQGEGSEGSHELKGTALSVGMSPPASHPTCEVQPAGDLVGLSLPASSPWLHAGGAGLQRQVLKRHYQ